MDEQGETNLKRLLATMQPVLHPSPYVFCPVGPATYAELPFAPLGAFHEQEGITIVARQEQAEERKLAFDASWACITLTVHSALSAVGFLAAISGQLARAGMAVNVISAYYHDHLFVLWDERARAMGVLAELSRSQ